MVSLNNGMMSGIRRITYTCDPEIDYNRAG